MTDYPEGSTGSLTGEPLVNIISQPRHFVGIDCIRKGTDKQEYGTRDGSLTIGPSKQLRDGQT